MQDRVFKPSNKKRFVDNVTGKDAMDIPRRRYYPKPGEGGSLDKNKSLKTDDKGLYTVVDKNFGIKAGRGGKYNMKQKGKSAR